MSTSCSRHHHHYRRPPPESFSPPRPQKRPRTHSHPPNANTAFTNHHHHRQVPHNNYNNNERQKASEANQLSALELLRYPFSNPYDKPTPVRHKNRNGAVSNLPRSPPGPPPQHNDRGRITTPPPLPPRGPALQINIIQNPITSRSSPGPNPSRPPFNTNQSNRNDNSVHISQRPVTLASIRQPSPAAPQRQTLPFNINSSDLQAILSSVASAVTQQLPMPMPMPIPQPAAVVVSQSQVNPPVRILPNHNNNNNNNNTPVSCLLSSLMNAGVISLPKEEDDSIGLDFPDKRKLNVRHESVVRSLYADLSRQCTTCGRRFKAQEEHRNHMDWHVRNNRNAKAQQRLEQKGKMKPSQKWFVRESLYLAGKEEGPIFDQPETTAAEMRGNDKEEAARDVCADENQRNCALCLEPFEDYYSDEVEEWLYRGAVYMNVPRGPIEGMDRSKLGPIVHDKCRPGKIMISR